MNDETGPAPLRVRAIAFGAEGYGRASQWSADFPVGLSLIIDAEGEAKKALLRVLAGEDVPEAGSVRWQDVDVAALPMREAQVFWRDPGAPWADVSPRQWAREVARRHPRWSDADWRAHAQGFKLDEHLDKEMFRLSTGSKRKVLLAAALASGAPLTLIDEPEAALDWPSIHHLRGALAREAARGEGTQRVIIVAHYEAVPDVPWAQTLMLGSSEI